MKKAQKLDLKDAWVTWARLGFGIYVYALFAQGWIGPVGFVWGLPMGAGNAGKKRFEVLGSYVVPQARRCGVRTRINQQIFVDYDVISTQNGSADGGLKFLRASGYCMDKRSGIWSKHRSAA